MGVHRWEMGRADIRQTRNLLRYMLAGYRSLQDRCTVANSTPSVPPLFGFCNFVNKAVVLRLSE